MRSFKQSFVSVSTKILIIYAATIGVFVGTFFTFYFISRVEIDNEFKRANIASFTNNINYINTVFKELKSNAYELREDAGFRQVAAGSDSLGRFSQVNALAKIVNHYNYIDDIFIYNPANGDFLSARGSINIDVYFRTVYTQSGLTDKWAGLVKDRQDFVSDIAKYPDRETSKLNDVFRGLLYIDMGNVNNNNIVIGFILNTEEIIDDQKIGDDKINNFLVIGDSGQSTLQSFLKDNIGYVLNTADIVRSGSINAIKARDSLIFYQFDTQRNLIYLNVINLEKYYRNLGGSSVMPVVMLSAMLLGVIAVTFLFLNKYRRNLKSIKGIIENDFVKSVVTKQSGTGFADSAKEFIGLNGIKQIIVIMVSAKVRSGNITEIDTHNYDRAFNIFLSDFGLRFKCLDFMKLKRMYFIDAKSIKDLPALLKAMQQGLTEHSFGDEEININLFVSRRFEGRDGIEKAIDEVVYLSENIPVKTSGQVILPDNEISNDYRYMPKELKNIFKNSIAGGEIANISGQIKEVLEKNISNGISMANFKDIILKINGVLSETFFESFFECYDAVGKVVNRINNLVNEVDASYICLFYDELTELLSGVSANNAAKGRNKLQKCFISYIEENYNKDIYLETLADYFNISAKYLSSKFKEEIGENFTDYLRNYRINAAKKLLGNSQLKINEISEQVGYNNVNVFIRQFRSVEGITPKVYRESV